MYSWSRLIQQSFATLDQFVVGTAGVVRIGRQVMGSGYLLPSRADCADGFCRVQTTHSAALAAGETPSECQHRTACDEHQKLFPVAGIHKTKCGGSDTRETGPFPSGQLLLESETECGRKETRDSIHPCRYEHKTRSPEPRSKSSLRIFRKFSWSAAEATRPGDVRVPTWHAAAKSMALAGKNCSGEFLQIHFRRRCPIND